MTWQFIVIAQIFVSSLTTLWARHITLTSKKAFYSVGAISYFAIAVAGLIYALINSKGIPALPVGIAWLYILIEGIAIPIAWFFQYKLITHIGASNTIVVATVNTIGAALLGIVFLDEHISISFIMGVLSIMLGVYIALIIKPDATHHIAASLPKKVSLVVGSFIFFSIGIFFEKQAITSIGVWNYAFFGWTTQFIVALMIYWLFGRSERKYLNLSLVKKALLLGFVTSIAGGLYILALSMGTLSHTVIATSGKVAVTMLLSAIFLNENNNMNLRLAAFAASMLGIALILF